MDTCSLVPGHATGHGGSSLGRRVLAGSHSVLGRASPTRPSPCLQDGQGSPPPPTQSSCDDVCMGLGVEALPRLCVCDTGCLSPGRHATPVAWQARGSGELFCGGLGGGFVTARSLIMAGCQLLCVPFVTSLCAHAPPPPTVGVPAGTGMSPATTAGPLR